MRQLPRFLMDHTLRHRHLHIPNVVLVVLIVLHCVLSIGCLQHLLKVVNQCLRQYSILPLLPLQAVEHILILVSKFEWII